MALPPFREDGWLPEGNYPTTWADVVAIFGGEPGSPRERVLQNLLQWRDALQNAGISGLLVLDGSFISRKAVPGDFDAIFVCDEHCEKQMLDDPRAKALTDYLQCKEQGLGDIVAFAQSTVRQFPHYCRLDGFDQDKRGVPKGVVEVRI